MKRLLLALPLAALTAGGASAQSPAGPRAAATYTQAHQHEILDEFVRLLSVPNVARNPADIRRNAELIVEMMRRRGLSPRVLEPADSTGRPAVYGEWKVPGARRTLVLYAHYDGQPTDPRDWTGSEPWKPLLRSAALEKGGEPIPFPAAGQPIDPEWRLYARSASDDKAGVMAILTAVDALKAAGVQPTSNLKFFFEGEEEAGSPGLAALLRRNEALLASDGWIFVDGPVHQSGRKQVVFGVRGDMNVDLVVYGANRPLHSGHYGNWAPNPAMALARLLASMKDDDGRVTIAGWYDDVAPLGPLEKAADAAAPAYDAELMKQLALGRVDGGGKSLVELLNQPSLNVNGFASADVGPAARNIIPTHAAATLDLRLVKGNDYHRQFQRLADHIRRQGYFVVDHDPSEAERREHPRVAKLTLRGSAYNASRTPMDLPFAREVLAAVKGAFGDSVVALPTSGGSLPLSVLTDALGAPTIMLPIANYDNNQHAENENIRLQNLWDGVATMAAVMTMGRAGMVP